MRTWNHRILSNKIDDSIGIYEIYYKGNGQKRSHSSDPIVVGNDLQDLQGEMINLLIALDEPIHGTEDNFDAGPRRTAAERLAAFNRVVERLREQLAVKALKE